MGNISIPQIADRFRLNVLSNEDDVKLHAYADIFKQIKDVYAPSLAFNSEYKFVKGGRADGTISNLVIEYKKYKYFDKQKGINEALFGRKQKNNDSGLYQYIINSISGDSVDDSILSTFGIGFDGNKWLIARFKKSSTLSEMDVSKTRFEGIYGCNKIDTIYTFDYKKYDLEDGIEELVTLFSSTQKMSLTKSNLIGVVSPKNEKIAGAIRDLYRIISAQNSISIPQRTTTLYNEWDRTFGTMFGVESQETQFNETSNSLKEMYGVDETLPIDVKQFLFAAQTYFNIFLKLLIDSFIHSLTQPTKFMPTVLKWSDITALFEGNGSESASYITNFFEIHFYEWFTYLAKQEDIEDVRKIVTETLSLINKFDLATFKLRPELIQDILQEIYMNFIPDKVRHLLGEYFSPDWIVEHALDKVGYVGDINSSLIDPCCGSGAFVIQALKRCIDKNQLGMAELRKITNSIVGFDLNPISAISAKANYIFVLFSSIDKTLLRNTPKLTIPIYIADSVLAPVTYSEQSTETFIAKSSVGNFVIPKFNSFVVASEFMDELSESIEKSRSFQVYANLSLSKYNLTPHQYDCVQSLYDKLITLHRSAQDSFWGKIIKNSFAPVILSEKFDFVVGNPPWVSWKGMSKTYREGTLEVWKSYGIFEKNAYDKKTTHDDFGMAVTYVALDQYLKNGGSLYFLLPWTFIKSTKGGEGFRKLEIIRDDQCVPLSITRVDDFNDIKIFKPKHTVRTIGVLFEKGTPMVYPMENWYEWAQVESRDIDSHASLIDIIQNFHTTRLSARPVDENNSQSSWMTLPSQSLSSLDKILLNGAPSNYKARKGIEPAGAKGVYILKTVKKNQNSTMISIENDIDRQRRRDLKNLGSHPGLIEQDFVFPFLGGRNIQRWKIKSFGFMLVPHTIDTPYGMDESSLAKCAPETYKWLEFYKAGLLASRIQNGKFFNPDIHPWYRLDNVGRYTFSKYKVIWKEQSSEFAAVAVSDSSSLPGFDSAIFGKQNKTIVVDSKVLMVATDTYDEACYIAGILNAPTVRKVIDSYAIGLNRGTDVVSNINIPTFDLSNSLHKKISSISMRIHEIAKSGEDEAQINSLETALDSEVKKLF